MSTIVSVFIFLGVIQVIFSQGPNGVPLNRNIPRECWGPPKGTNIFQCCPLPVMHTEEELRTCNVDTEGRDLAPRDFKEHCSQKLCLLRNKGILNPDDTIDYAKMVAFVDAWAENKPYLAEGVRIAKEICFTNESEEKDAYSARGILSCEPDKLFHCLTGNIIWNCKLNDEMPSCKLLKVHMDECRPYLYKEPQLS